MVMKDIIEQFDNVDDPDALERSKKNRALKIALNWLRPCNWHGSGLNPDDVLRMADETGIPVVWVPPAEVLIEVVAAEPSDRISVLVSHEDKVLDQCEALIEKCGGPELRDSRTLVEGALAAFRAGHHEATMAVDQGQR